VRLFLTLLATPTAALLLLSSPLSAQEPVETEAETYINPVPIERNNPSYPRAELEQSREGWVMLSYIITPEGSVAEPMIENSSGGEAFEKAALQAISRWRYSPATRDGEPVEQSMVKTRVVFQLERDGQTGGTRTFRRTYAEAADHIAAGNLDAALPLVDKLEFGTRVNLYEDAWFWWLKYSYLEASESADNEEQIDALQLALGYEEDYLEPELFVAAAHSLFVLRVRVGDYSAARTTFLRLRDSRTAQRSERYQETIALLSPIYRQIEDAVAGTRLLVVDAKIGKHDYWVHDLLRRSFAMADVTGRIDAVDIRCERATKRYDTFPADSVWHVPQSWGNCGVYIKGEPGTTFKFEEYPPSVAATLLSQ
jgi:TonB family protein